MTTAERNEINEEIKRRFSGSDWLLRAVRAAVLDHKRAGNPVATSRNGKVVLVPPEEINVSTKSQTHRSRLSSTRSM